MIDSGSFVSSSTSTRHPVINAANSYLDSKQGLVCTSKVTSRTDRTRYYSVFETDDVENTFAGEDASVPVKLFHTKDNSINSVQFIYKDGWLYEVLQQNCGLSEISTDYSCTLNDSEANPLNNMVYVYDLRKAEISSTESTDVSSYLSGVYATELTDNAAILDIEVSG